MKTIMKRKQGQAKKIKERQWFCTRHRQSCAQCGLTMTSHNATRNAHDVMWKWIGWQRQRRTCYRVQYHNVTWWYIFPFWTIEHNKHVTLSSCAQQKYFPSHDSWNVSFLACFDRDMFRSKYVRRVRPWSFSMLCRWRHWERGMYVLAAPATSYSRDLTEYMTADAWSRDTLEAKNGVSRGSRGRLTWEFDVIKTKQARLQYQLHNNQQSTS